jgi:uncharacterized protein (TIGR03437 family)
MGPLRKWRRSTILLGFILAGQARYLDAASAPVIQAVTDAAGYGPRVAPGSLASIFGANLASSEVSASGFPLSTNLGGASVVIGGVSAPLAYVSSGQINFQMPSSVGSGDATLIVNGPGGASSSFSVMVTSSAPAIFQYGANHAMAYNSDGSLNGDSAPAASA